MNSTLVERGSFNYKIDGKKLKIAGKNTEKFHVIIQSTSK